MIGFGINVSRPIAEILIIVVSVLIALGLDNWNDNRVERNLESQYLGRLLEEVSFNANTVEDNLGRANRKISHLSSVDAILRQPRNSRSMADLVTDLRSGALSMGWALPEFADVVFEELRSTGRLGIIRDVELREMLVNYDLELANGVERIDNRRGGFAKYVYGLLPPEYLLPGDSDSPSSGPDLDNLTEDHLSTAVDSEEFRQLLNAERNYATFILDLMQILQPLIDELEKALEQATR